MWVSYFVNSDIHINQIYANLQPEVFSKILNLTLRLEILAASKVEYTSRNKGCDL
ncbi:hypothetical protein ALTERO38_90267 [Alteromonas sp. 38]|nr:hypothetical protein ALTER154_10181 [Alteromonas sp. 154]VXC53587.1 hypothetical protein ALTERO38_90267 [Alteromonas sp. 38]